MTAKDIRIGQVYIESAGVYLLTSVEHDAFYRYVTLRKLWLWHVNAGVIGRHSQAGSPWECSWQDELVT